jgi:hypothetical protein
MGVFSRGYQNKISFPKTPNMHIYNELCTTCGIITGLFISLKMHYENVSEKKPISVALHNGRFTLK